jgi:aspartate aminotransferase
VIESARSDVSAPSPSAAPNPPPAIELSATLAADERVRLKIASGAPVVHLAFGEAGLPVLPSIRAVLGRAAGENAYGPVVGSVTAREAASGYFGRRGLVTQPDQIIFAPGSKALLFALLRVLPGDVVLPCPSWVTYAAQAALVGKRVWRVPIGAAGGLPDPALLEESLAAARRAGLCPGVLLVTLPDNPTGTVASPELVRAVAGIAEANSLLIISDEIYRDLTFRGTIASPAEFLPATTFVTSGLSKSTALGGWRIGFARMPDSAIGRAAHHAVQGLASEVWSSLAAPMQRVAAHVLAEPDDLREHVERSRRLHERTSLAVYDLLLAAGLDCRRPSAAFYLYPDLEPLRPQLATLGVQTVDELTDALLERCGIAVLGGTAFGDSPGRLRCRIATSLLYGRTEAERWQALAHDEPTTLPWIREALHQIQASLAAIQAAEWPADLR